MRNTKNKKFFCLNHPKNVDKKEAVEVKYTRELNEKTMTKTVGIFERSSELGTVKAQDN